MYCRAGDFCFWPKEEIAKNKFGPRLSAGQHAFVDDHDKQRMRNECYRVAREAAPDVDWSFLNPKEITGVRMDGNLSIKTQSRNKKGQVYQYNGDGSYRFVRDDDIVA